MANKDPMAIYKSMGQSEMFSFITINNLMVSFRVFITGILVGIGSIVSLFYEGIRIGAFESFFHQNGVLKESLFTVWLHGTPEISAIIIAGAAGITLGKGLVFPGDKSRFVSFKHSGRESLRIMLATVPIFFLAAFIEGYLTRYTEISYTVRGFIILTSLIAIVFYFVIYPIIIAKSHSKENVIDDRPAISGSKIILWRFICSRSFQRITQPIFKTFYATAKMVNICCTGHCNLWSDFKRFYWH
ncbi:MAG: stage II sporulation protein M [Saprospiraceae bacterium]|nr:stage II sporulation protein M [Saprospiraceae bacterium]